MRWLWWILLPLLLLGCGSASSEDKNEVDADQLALGQQVYDQYCAACHGPNGEGQNPAAPLQKDETGRFPAPPHDSTGHTWHHDDDLLIQIIKEGGMGNPEDFYEMPTFGEVLNDEQIEAVLALFRTWWSDEQRAAQQERTQFARDND